MIVLNTRKLVFETALNYVIIARSYSLCDSTNVQTRYGKMPDICIWYWVKEQIVWLICLYCQEWVYVTDC